MGRSGKYTFKRQRTKWVNRTRKIRKNAIKKKMDRIKEPEEADNYEEKKASELT